MSAEYLFITNIAFSLLSLYTHVYTFNLQLTYFISIILTFFQKYFTLAVDFLTITMLKHSICLFIQLKFRQIQKKISQVHINKTRKSITLRASIFMFLQGRREPFFAT